VRLCKQQEVRLNHIITVPLGYWTYVRLGEVLIHHLQDRRVDSWRLRRVLAIILLYDMGAKSLVEKITFDFVRFYLPNNGYVDSSGRTCWTLTLAVSSSPIAETRHSCSIAHTGRYVYIILYCGIICYIMSCGYYILLCSQYLYTAAVRAVFHIIRVHVREKY